MKKRLQLDNLLEEIQELTTMQREYPDLMRGEDYSRLRELRKQYKSERPSYKAIPINYHKFKKEDRING